MIKGSRKLEHESRINNERRKGEWHTVVPIDNGLFDGRPVVAVRDRPDPGQVERVFYVWTRARPFQPAWKWNEVVSRLLVIPRISKAVNTYSASTVTFTKRELVNLCTWPFGGTSSSLNSVSPFLRSLRYSSFVTEIYIFGNKVTKVGMIPENLRIINYQWQNRVSVMQDNLLMYAWRQLEQRSLLFCILDRREKIISEKIGYTIFYRRSTTPRRILSTVKSTITRCRCVGVRLSRRWDTTHCNCLLSVIWRCTTHRRFAVSLTKVQ